MQIKPECPKCGGELGVEVRDGEPRGDDKVICTSCGFVVGERNEVSRQVVSEHGDEIKKAAADQIRDALRKAFR